MGDFPVKNAIILGSAACMSEDFGYAKFVVGTNFDLWAVKYAGVVCPLPLKGWVSLHVEKFFPLIEERRKRGFPDAENLIVHRKQLDREIGKWTWPEGAQIQPDFQWGKTGNSGSSTLYAIRTLFDLGYEKIVLCGCPMDKSINHLERGGLERFSKAAENFKTGWLEAMPKIKGRVKSMSGWTMQHLGEPPYDWFEKSSSH